MAGDINRPSLAISSTKPPGAREAAEFQNSGCRADFDCAIGLLELRLAEWDRFVRGLVSRDSSHPLAISSSLRRRWRLARLLLSSSVVGATLVIYLYPGW